MSPSGVGIGLRQPHYRHFAPGVQAPGSTGALPGFVEVHSENFFAEGGAALAVLHGVRERLDVSLHGVGLALGSAAGIDEWHLERLARLAQRIGPVRVSDHACFARVLQPASGEALHGADLLPIAFTEAQLQILCANVQRVQDRLRRPLLVENLSAYLSLEDEDAWPEAAFLAELARRSGCGLLLDLNNLVVNALNEALHPRPGREIPDPVAAACAFVDALPPGIVGEIHLAGYRHTGPLVIDDHGTRVHPSVWEVYRHTLRRLGPVPTLIEWDTDLPPIEVLLGEAARAAQLQREVAEMLPSTAVPPPSRAATDAPPSADSEESRAESRAVGKPVFPPPDASARPCAPALDGGLAVRGVEPVSAEVEALRQRALIEALRFGGGAPDEANGADAAQTGQASRAAQAARLRERGERLQLGLGAYRAHATLTAARALEAAYPTVAAMVGDEALASLARALWQASPPCRGDLAQWGLDLPAFIETRPELDPWPYLADAARLDAALMRCESAADAEPEPATLELLATQDPARLRLRLMPCVQLLASRWPIATLHAVHQGLWKAVTDTGASADADFGPAGDLGQDAASGPESVFGGSADDARLAPAREALADGRAESVVVAREGWRAVVQEVAPSDFAWMQALQERLPLDAALVRAGRGFDFEAWLRQAVAARWLQRAEVCDEGAGLRT